MLALILAGGKGTRLQPFTCTIPRHEAGKGLVAAFGLPPAHRAVPRATPEADLRELMGIAEGFVQQSRYEPARNGIEDDADIAAVVARVVPEFAHGGGPHRLDDRM